MKTNISDINLEKFCRFPITCDAVVFYVSGRDSGWNEITLASVIMSYPYIYIK